MSTRKTRNAHTLAQRAVEAATSQQITLPGEALGAQIVRTLAQQVLDQDDELDRLKTQVFRELLTYMLQDPTTIEPALDLILISRHLERIGDHATNIAEDVIFIVSARDVRHHADLQSR